MKKVWIFLVVLICVFLMTRFPDLMISPGKLSSGHQNLSDSCSACHQPFWGIKNEKCIVCHQISDIGKEKLNGIDSSLGKTHAFHKKLGNQSCTTCHKEHIGISPGNTGMRFDHKFLSASEKQCASCHVIPGDKLHATLNASCEACHNFSGWKNQIKFDHTLILSTDINNCIACHQKPSDSYHQKINDNCSMCHTNSQWKPSTFNHTSHFQLDEHHNASCNKCHTTNNYSTYSCYGCHEHSPNKIQEKHLKHGIPNFTNCVSCHKSGSEHEGNENKDNRGNDDD